VTQFDMTDMTAVRALWRFVIVLLRKRFVTLITQFLRISAKVLTNFLPHPYFDGIRPNAWWPAGPHAGDRG